MKQIKLFAALIVTTLVVAISCKKSDNLAIPPSQAHFTNENSGAYFITAPGVTKAIPVGLTTVSNVDRTVTFTVTSPTGAVEGTHYTLGKSSLVIPAGKTLDSIVVNGNYSMYTTNRKDTLIFTITGVDKGSSVPNSDYNSTYTLFMRGPCSELEINDPAPSGLASFIGDYHGVKEYAYNNNTGALLSTYFPYQNPVTVKSATLTSPTTADLVVANLFDATPQWNDVTVKLDWTDINDRKVTLVQQVVGDAGQMNPAYTGMQLTANPLGAANPTPAYGTFSFCTGTIRIKMRLCIPSLGGCFTSQYVFDLIR